MMFELKKLLFAGVGSAMLIGFAPAAQGAIILGVDYGFTGHDVQAGHQGVDIANTAGGNPVVASDGGVTASLLGVGDADGLEGRGPGQPSRAVVVGTSVDALVGDLASTRDGNFELTITGLAAGSYFVRSYHNENTFTGDGFNGGGGTVTAMEGATLLGTVDPINLASDGSTSTLESSVGFIDFTITSDGSTAIVIDYTTTNPNGFLFINGVTISDTPIPEPGSLALLGLGGLALLRRRRA